MGKLTCSGLPLSPIITPSSFKTHRWYCFDRYTSQFHLKIHLLHWWPFVVSFQQLWHFQWCWHRLTRLEHVMDTGLNDASKVLTNTEAELTSLLDKPLVILAIFRGVPLCLVILFFIFWSGCSWLFRRQQARPYTWPLPTVASKLSFDVGGSHSGGPTQRGSWSNCTFTTKKGLKIALLLKSTEQKIFVS